MLDRPWLNMFPKDRALCKLTFWAQDFLIWKSTVYVSSVWFKQSTQQQRGREPFCIICLHCFLFVHLYAYTDTCTHTYKVLIHIKQKVVYKTFYLTGKVCSKFRQSALTSIHSAFRNALCSNHYSKHLSLTGSLFSLADNKCCLMVVGPGYSTSPRSERVFHSSDYKGSHCSQHYNCLSYETSSPVIWS